MFGDFEQFAVSSAKYRGRAFRIACMVGGQRHGGATVDDDRATEPGSRHSGECGGAQSSHLGQVGVPGRLSEGLCDFRLAWTRQLS